VLARLEKTQGRPNAEVLEDLPLFAAMAPADPEADANDAGSGDLIAALAELNPDELSPREALEALYRLKALS
jgi:DNA mismatch repair protein MutS